MDSLGNNNWHQFLIDKSTAMMFVTNSHNQMLWCNQRYKDMFGHDQDYVNKKGILQFAQENLHPDDVDSYMNSMKELTNKNLTQMLAIYRQKGINNDWRTIIVTGRVIKWLDNDIPEEFLGVGIDVTDQFASFTKFENLLKENIYLKNKLKLNCLTKREIEILTLISEGNSTKEIAELKNISFHTAEWHRKNISRKLGIHKSSELVRFAVESGL